MYQSHVHISIWDIWVRTRTLNKSKKVKIDKTNNEAMMNPKVNDHSLKSLSYLLPSRGAAAKSIKVANGHT